MVSDSEVRQHETAGLCILPEPEYYLLDQRVIPFWRVSNLIGFGLLLFFLLIGVLVWKVKGGPFWWLALTGWLLLSAFCVWFSFWYPVREWRAWGWRIDERVLELRSGVWFRVTRMLPLNRLQHVDLRRGPIERLFGLASLVLHTAGTHSASLTIPGLAAEEAARLRDRLVQLGGTDAA